MSSANKNNEESPATVSSIIAHRFETLGIYSEFDELACKIFIMVLYILYSTPTENK